MSGCSCDASVLARDQAVPGPVTCLWCAGPWQTGGEQVTLSADLAARLAAVLDSGGLVAWVGGIHDIVIVPAPEVVPVPGTARVHACPECDHGDDRGEACIECDGSGYLVQHACPGCGDTAMWRYVSGRAVMACQRCGAAWTSADAAWLAQRVPDRLLAVAS
jgi:hypothetical protein